MSYFFEVTGGQDQCPHPGYHGYLATPPTNPAREVNAAANENEQRA